MSAAKQNWPRVKLGEVCEFRRGLTYSKKDEVSSSKNVVLRSNNVDLATGKVDLSELKYISDSFVVPSEKKVAKGSVLMCMANGSKSHLGKVALIGEDYGYAFGGFMGLLVPSVSVLPSYLYWILSGYEFKQLIASLTDGANINNLKFADVADFEFPLPPLPVQREIVARLERELGAVDELAKKFDELEQAAEAEFKAELKETFEEVSRGGEMHRRSYASEGTFADGEPAGRASVCETRRLGEIGRVAMCKRILKEQTTPCGEVPFYKIGTFGKEANAYISRAIFEDYKSRFSYPKPGDVLISAAGTIGRTVVFDGKPAYFQDSNIVWLEHDSSRLLNEYLNCYFWSMPWAVSDGATIPRLYNADIEGLVIPLLPKDAQRAIVARLDAAKARKEALVSAAKRGRETAAVWRKAILKEAFE